MKRSIYLALVALVATVSFAIKKQSDNSVKTPVRRSVSLRRKYEQGSGLAENKEAPKMKVQNDIANVQGRSLAFSSDVGTTYAQH